MPPYFSLSSFKEWILILTNLFLIRYESSQKNELQVVRSGEQAGNPID